MERRSRVSAFETKAQLRIVLDDCETVNRIIDVSSGQSNGNLRKTKTSNPNDDGRDSSGDESDGSDYQKPNVSYFMQQATRVKTSDRTLANVDLSYLDANDSGQFSDETLSKEKMDLLKMYETKFDKWFNLMSRGFSLILHGLGSKRQILESFTYKWLADEHRVVIHGFFSELNHKSVLAILSEAVNAEGSDEDAIYEAVESLDYTVFVVIHSLDTLLANNGKLKQFLVNLVKRSQNCIHLICSADHVNSGLLFTPAQNNALQLLWLDAPTYQSYEVERGYATPVTSRHSTLASNMRRMNLTMKSIEHVYCSLTPNAQKVFLLILDHYVRHRNDELVVKLKVTDASGSKWKCANKTPIEDSLTMNQLFYRCKEEFLLHSELSLRSQLTEFKDHQLIKLGRNAEGSEVIDLMFDVKLAQSFYEKSLTCST